MPTLENFRTANWTRRINRVAQIFLAVLAVLAINYLASRYFIREDLSRQSIYSLSPETVAYLRTIREPVEVIVTIPEDNEGEDKALLYRYVKNLLEEYRYASRQGGQEMLRIEFVDPFRHLKRAEELAQRFKIDQPYVVIVARGDRQRVIVPSEIIDFVDMRPSALKGEQALTSAILEVAGDDAPVIYFVTGHGEMGIDSVSPNRGLSAIVSELRSRNIQVRSLDLTTGPAPEDADLLVVADPEGPFLAEEAERLRSFINRRDGRAIFLLGPGKDAGLQGLLARWGVRLEDMVVLETGGDYLQSAGSILIRSFADHPVTAPLIQNRAPVLAGLPRPILMQPETPGAVHITPLLASSPSSWAERAWRQPGAPRFDEGVDLMGPLPVAVLAEVGSSSLGISVPGGRIAVIGIGELVSNNRISSFGNLSFFISLTNWMLEREQVIAAPPRPVQRYSLSLSQQDLLNILLVLLAPAAAAGLLGLVIAASRRY